MKHRQCFETITFCLLICLPFYLFAAPLMEIPSAALELDTTVPIIAHEVINVGRRGESFNVIAYIGDNNRIRRSTIKIKYGGKAVEGEFPVMEKEKTVPVVVTVASDSARVYSEANSRSPILSSVAVGTRLFVSRTGDRFYRVLNKEGLRGYISTSNVTVSLSGYQYGATLPEKITEYPYIFYQIRALDEFGNLAETKFVEVRFLTDDEIAELRGKKVRLKTFSRQGGSPFYKKIWFWLTMAATAGGAYYYVTKEQQENKANVTISVQWY